MRTTVAIQAGGHSRRMGQDKALVLLHGRPLLAHVLERVRPLADELLITTNRPAAYAAFDARSVADAEPGLGALPGLQTALAAASNQRVLVVACDMPLLNAQLLRYLLDCLTENGVDAVVPVWDERDQPLHAVYRRDVCLVALRAALAAGQQRVNSFLPAIRVRRVPPAEIAALDPHGLSFTNINTPADLMAVANLSNV